MTRLEVCVEGVCYGVYEVQRTNPRALSSWPRVYTPSLFQELVERKLMVFVRFMGMVVCFVWSDITSQIPRTPTETAWRKSLCNHFGMLTLGYSRLPMPKPDVLSHLAQALAAVLRGDFRDSIPLDTLYPFLSPYCGGQLPLLDDDNDYVRLPPISALLSLPTPTDHVLPPLLPMADPIRK